jgi:hypothetical protein
MGYEQVEVYVLDARDGSTPIDGVLVRVYDSAGKVYFTEATTGVDGKAGFLLFTQQYSLRFYKFQVGFSQPQYIDVLGGGGNAFNVLASPHEPPVAQDPRLCRASGYFRDVTGAPRAQLDMHFISEFRPVLLDDALVMDERRQLKTDKDGFACIDLIRCGNYLVTLEAYEDTTRRIRVPDAPSCNLPHLLFPVISRITVDPVSVSVGTEQKLEPSVYDSAGVPVPGTANGDVKWELEDPTVALLTVTADYLLVKGLKTGSTTLKASRINTSIIRIPDSGITGVPVGVVVT